MDEFLPVLVAGLIIIIVLIVAGGPLVELAGGPAQQGRAVASFSVGRVGYSDATTARTIKFGDFVLGETQEEEVFSVPESLVSEGYFGSESKGYTIHVDKTILNNIKGLSVVFSPTDDMTTGLGNLVIEWNGVELYNDIPKLNKYTLPVISDYVKEENTLKIKSGGPGLAFWAATRFRLANVKAVAEYGPEKYFSFELFPSEMQAWGNGSLSFYTTRGEKGTMNILLNGRNIYSTTNPEHLTIVDLPFSKINNIARSGDNVLTIQSNDVIHINDLKMEIALSTNSVAPTKTFSISSEDASSLKSRGGLVSFNVVSVNRQGILNIELNGKRVDVQSVKEGSNQVEVAGDSFVAGSNTAAFSGSGSWDISNVTIAVKI